MGQPDFAEVNSKSGTWVDVPDQPSPTIARLKYLVRDGICYVNLYDNSTYSFTGGTWVTLGTIPARCRPSETVYGSWNNRNAKGGEIAITNAGAVMINSNHTGTMFISASIAVPIAY